MWAGKAIIRPGWAVFTGTAGDHAPHRHHAVQVAIGIRGPVRLWAEMPGALTAQGAVIPADHAHQLASGPDPLLLIYLERESAPGRRLDAWCGGRARSLPDAKSKRLADSVGEASAALPATLDPLLAIILDSPASETARVFSDERIARSIAGLPRPLPATLTAAALAQQAGLSPGRYAHLFRAHTGMPLRPYLRWLRLQQALAEVAQGANLTDAAYAAGFSDSAHLSRSFRRTFGIAPKVLRHPALSLKSGAS